MIIEAVFATLFGLIIGSFLNVCIYRLPRDLSVVTPRSHCPHCEHTIRWYDNIPLVSFFLLRGHCRDCGADIPVRYPLVELLTGLVFGASILTFGLTWTGVKFCLFGAILIDLIFTDLEERILPDEFTLGGSVVGILFAAFVPLPFGIVQLLLSGRDARLVSVLDAIFAAALCSGALWGVGKLYERVRGREGVGPGDIKMVAMIGAFLGLQGALLTLMAGSLLGSLVGLIFIFATGKNASTYELPFGTFLGAAAMLVAALGEGLLGWYRRLM